MASFGSSLGGGFSMLCGGTFDLGSYCIQRTIIDAINLLFLSIFCIFLLSGSVKRLHGRSWGSIVVSVTCALTSFAYFGAGLWELVARSDWFGNLNWLVYFTRGLVWISFTLALLVQGSKWVRIVISVWWVSFFLLVSALNVEILLRSHSVQVSDLAPWPLNLLLVFYSLRNFTRSVSEPTLDKGISEPLLGKNAEKTRTELGQAGFFSKLTFSWVNPLLSLGYMKTLTLQDIPSLVSEDEADSAYRKFSQEWSSLLREKGSKDTKHLAFRAIAKVHLKENVFIGFCALMRTSCVVLSPLLLYAFVGYTNQAEDIFSDGLFIVACLMFIKVVESLSQRHWFFLARRSGMRIRSALMVAVYQKQLKLSSSGKRSHSTGEIVNYIAVDAYRMGECAWWFHSAWTLAIQLVLAIGVLFLVVGLGSLPGLVPLFICGLLHIPFARIIKNCQTQFMMSQDERLRSTSEILNCMKIIKLQSWEEKFKNLIESRRAKEFKWLSEAQLKKAYGTIMYWMSPTLISSVVFVGCVYFQSAPLNAGTIFTVLSTLRAMREPVRMIPEALSAVILVKVSFDRINTFLLADELQVDETKKFRFKTRVPL